jgi:hypothetical protein
MNVDELRSFLLEANKAGYANESGSNDWVKEKDHSTTIKFSSGDFRMHDNFFGGEPFGGRMVVFYKNQASWMMVYYGLVDSSYKNFEEVYPILQSALSQPPKDLPLRGPKEFEKGEFRYENTWKGNLEEYSGYERIFKNGEEIYKAQYSGGLVDVRKED